MKQKPLIYILISLFCLIEPMVKLFYFKVSTDFDFSIIFSNVFARTGVKEIFDFWLVFPFTGLMLIKIRRWTYFSFMGLLLYNVYSILTYEKYTWPYYSESPFLYHYILVGICCAGFIYFLFPEVRDPFFDKTIRWWETKKRYGVQIPCKIKLGSSEISSDILNISQTGAFIKATDGLSDIKAADLIFDYKNIKLSIPIICISTHKYQNQEGFGYLFNIKNWGAKLQVARLIRIIKKEAEELR
jgi:hypothetical protein